MKSSSREVLGGVVSLSLFALHACGGSAVSAPAPVPASAATPASTPLAATTAAARAAPKPHARASGSCDDGSCFRCGDAVCPTGYFCVVGKSGHGCSWLPACVAKPSCACLSAALPDPHCACEEKQGGVVLSCDGAVL